MEIRSHLCIMKKRITFTLAAALLVSAVFGLGYWSGFSHARQSTRVLVGTEASNSQAQTSRKGVYVPYFTQGNPTPDQVKQ
jgi:hypothetical protein